MKEKELVGVAIKVPKDLKEAFFRTCHESDQNAAQVLRQLMREYVAKHGQGDLLK